jgi:hypothetical protein
MVLKAGDREGMILEVMTGKERDGKAVEGWKRGSP